jgi:hypothetical protein
VCRHRKFECKVSTSTGDEMLHISKGIKKFAKDDKDARLNDRAG